MESNHSNQPGAVASAQINTNEPPPASNKTPQADVETTTPLVNDSLWRNRASNPSYENVNFGIGSHPSNLFTPSDSTTKNVGRSEVNTADPTSVGSIESPSLQETVSDVQRISEQRGRDPEASTHRRQDEAIEAVSEAMTRQKISDALGGRPTGAGGSGHSDQPPGLQAVTVRPLPPTQTNNDRGRSTKPDPDGKVASEIVGEKKSRGRS